MAHHLPRVFLHAFHSDGIISSICRRCQMTVASKANEIDLRKPEDDHICSGFGLRGMLNPEQAVSGEK